MTSLPLPAAAPDRRRALAPLVLATALLGALCPATARSEPPPAPDAPTVGRVVGVPNSLGVRWTAPDNTGRPAIESYDVQYRTPREPWWSMPPKNVADTAATLTHLLRNTRFEVQVRAKNADGDGPWSESGWGTTGRNTAPSFGATTTRSVAENTEPGQPVGDPVTATDPDWNDTLTYSLEGTDAAAFDIDSNSGQILTMAPLDHAARSSYSVTVVTRDTDDASDSIEITIAVIDTNDPPSFDPADNMRSVAENTEPGQPIGDPVTATDPDPGDTLTYSLEDKDDAAAFDIDAATGQLLTKAVLDYETRSSYSVTVVARDDDDADASIEVTIAVTDTNDPPSFDPTDNMRSVAENTEPGQPIGAPVTATDPDPGDTLTYSLEDKDDAAAFDIDAATGQLLTKDALDYETRSSYSVTVVARDDDDADASIEVTIAVTDVNDPPSFDSTDNTRSVAENTEPGRPIGDPVAATDPDPGDTLTYSLGGADVAAFGIDEGDGQLRTGATLDHETRSSYSVTVVARDGHGASASIEVTISVTDENDPPSFDPADNMRSVAENTEPGQPIGDPVTATDPDPGDTLTYGLEGPDAGAFDIDATGGQLRTRAALDRETRSSYSVTVVARDDDGTRGTIEVTISVTDENDPPSFDPADNMRSVAENTEPGRPIGGPVAATDPDPGDTLTYSLEGADAAEFGIDAASGHLLTRAALDHETRASYSVTVMARDDDGAGASIEVTIEVTDANDAPAFDPADNMRSVAENTAPGQPVGDPVAATDPDPDDTLTYSLEGADAAEFGIDAASGQIRTGAALDHETRASYSVTVVARDDDGAGDSIEVTIAVTDEPESPSFDGPSTARSVAENTPAGQPVGDPVAAMDPDSGDTLTYSLGGTDSAAFDVDASSGQILTSAALDHEAKSSHAVTVTVQDARGATDSIDVAISVTDTDEPPDAPAAPTFSRVTDESLTVHWTAPSTADRPDVTSYDLRYRAGTDSAFTDGPQDVTATTATIPGLGPNITYHVQVRATNDEGDGPWSAPGTTITINDEALQQAWLAHFGRTVAGQVVNAVTARLEGGGAHVAVDGTQLRPFSGTREGRDPLAFRPGSGGHDAGTAAGTPGMTERGLTPGSSFHLTSGAGPQGSALLSAWGRYASERFRSVDEKIELDGEVATAILGADAQWDRMLAGVALSFSDAEGEFSPGHAASPGKGEGTIDSSLNSVHPYLRYELKEGISVWGLAGYGSGDLAHTDDGTTPIDTGITMRMGALGARSELLSPSERSGLALALKSDVFWMRMESEAAEESDGRGLKRARARATRLRLLLEGSQSYPLDYGAMLTPSLEAGLRSDGGDGETGSGVEVRAGLRYSAPGMTVEASAHSLLGHQRREYEEWGASGSIRFAPGSSGRGLSLTVAPSWGAAPSGVDRLWSIRDAGRLNPDGDIEPGGRLEAEIGYGVGMSGDLGVLTPYTGLSLADGGGRTWRLGGRWDVAPAFSMSLEGDRREDAGGGSPERSLMLRGAMRW